ncbi:MAG TPA: hypothetical protein VGO34_03010 [Alphaproteobacteria bacterium]|jgi:photosystem II stability/assembly factor-like uncharacterized protein
MGTTVYLSTGRGVVALKEEANGTDWKIEERHFLPDWEITELHVDSQNRIIAATRGDGVWFQEDTSGRGRTGGWVKPGSGRLGPSKVHCLAFDPVDPDTIYAGTEPIGIWVTHDRGKNWEQLEGVWKVPAIPSVTYPVPTVEAHVRDITIDPNNRDVIYAALQVGFMIKSSDRGKTWKLLDKGIDPDVHTLVIRPDDTKRIYAATGGHGFREGQTNGRALYASEDAGETWKALATDFYQEYSVSLAMHPANANLLLTTVANNHPPWKGATGAEAKVIISKDGGKSWTEAKGVPAEIGPEFPGSIVFDPAKPNDAYLCTHKGSMFRSRDAGENWERMPVDLASAIELIDVGLGDMKVVHS